MKNKGFTLAEVLIALVIIGVIAAMTVPTLMNRTNNQEFVSKLKKTYSTLSQVTNKIIAEEGPVKSWEDKTIDDVYELYKSKLNNAKECGPNTGCVSQGVYKKLDGGSSGLWDEHEGYRKLILADGVQVIFSELNLNCTKTNDTQYGSKDFCMFIDVDLNGERKPNAIGRDEFEFVLKNNGLYPSGCDFDGLCDKEHSGYACACKVLREGAINY